MLAWIQFLSFLIVSGFSLYIFLVIMYNRYLNVKMGQPKKLDQELGTRLKIFFVQVFVQTKLMKDPKSGIMHLVVFYGFIILQFGALDIIVKGFGFEGLPIPGYDVFVLTQEVTVFLILLAIGYAAYRRYGEKLPRLKKGWKPSIVIFLIISLMISVLGTLAFERVFHSLEASWFAPITSFIAAPFQGFGTTVGAIGFYTFWWIHLLILLSFLIYVPQSKHFHLIVAPINIFLGRTDSVGRLEKLDLEDENAESFGVGKIEDFTQKQMLDYYACVECGRCTNVCPASNTGKLLSPMHLIVKLRDHLTEKGAVTSKTPWTPAFAFPQPATHGVQAVSASGFDWSSGPMTTIEPTLQRQKQMWTATEKPVDELNLIGDVMTEEEIWACTTCRNCEDQCPVGNEHVDKIIDLRRHLVLMEGSVPTDGQRAMQNIERQSNPWGINRNSRADWKEEEDVGHVPTVKENPDFEILYFVGSMGSYDNRSMKISKSFTRLLNKAGVNFAILGNEEKNSGDTPRRMGNELLFQELCMENISIFEKYNVKKIVTACPHTFNTFKNEYPDFGLEGVEILHHTELLDQLIKEKRLVPTHEMNERITYHDSCYLGRYNNVYDQPRDILRAIPGVELIEMTRSRENGMCCGAGGGMMWMEEDTGKRVNIARTEQALEVNPSVISSACPFCLTMLADGTKSTEVETVKTKDIAEILDLAVFGEPSVQNE
ncbi:(Fe-S)-binding protein [Alkalicoccobacillus gibsonii]|uniref:heterodisulfide reductase-related iron-sulfur binding cluster n=1 Tax=Alkalicoccobacillus gibsonii TaxID=79881 RepID=UPI00193362D6|nr:(Fe-S)-binding protein [Alkalicoccobacillus gibsonii]MBM0066890.1 4Fe-4S dicluster domain-containing protein [Alkalicoccobacillus gibsonii]